MFSRYNILTTFESRTAYYFTRSKRKGEEKALFRSRENSNLSLGKTAQYDLWGK